MILLPGLFSGFLWGTSGSVDGWQQAMCGGMRMLGAEQLASLSIDTDYRCPASLRGPGR